MDGEENKKIYKFHMHGGALRERSEKPDQFLSDLVGEAKIMAELGCGSGFYCKYLQKYAEKLYCVDMDREALEELKKTAGNNVIILNEDASHTSISSNTIDLVLFANSFHDMEKEKVYKELLRILKKIGKVIIIDWEKKETTFGPPMRIRMSKEDYIKYFKDFELEKEFVPGQNHYGLVFKRIC
ncbi:MAG: class I SAM-dependent methyltransferase [Candidatus Micrarchaeia archaeon]